MLRPALTHLLHVLDDRKNALTDFEAALHAELLALAQESRPESGPAASDLAKAPGVRRLSVDIGSFQTQVDLTPGGGWAGGGTMQTNCSYDKCPNKRAR